MPTRITLRRARTPQALNNATLPFVIALAQKGTHRVVEDPHLLAGLNVAGGVIACESGAQSHGLAFQPAASVIERLTRQGQAYCAAA